MFISRDDISNSSLWRLNRHHEQLKLEERDVESHFDAFKKSLVLASSKRDTLKGNNEYLHYDHDTGIKHDFPFINGPKGSVEKRRHSECK